MAVDSETMKSSQSGHSSSKNECHWLGCPEPGPFPTVDGLVEHVQRCHLVQFKEEEFVVCLWEGCKVFNRPFEKKDWLPQHMRRHTNERPHKCFMNGCNMSFWNVHALQNHLQLHFKPSLTKQKKSMQKKLNRSSSSSSSPPPYCMSMPSAKKVCLNGISGQSDDDSSTQSDIKRKRQTALKVRIPLHSSIKLSSIRQVSPVPVPINGSVVHEDPIDLSTLSVIKKAILTHLLAGSAATKQSGVCLTGKVIGRRSVGKLEYLVRWSPMLIPDSWVPVSDYNGHRTILISDMSHCQRSALVQSRFFTNEGRRIDNCRKRRRE